MFKTAFDPVERFDRLDASDIFVSYERGTSQRKSVSPVTSFFNLLLNFFVKLFFGVIAALFAISLLAAGLVYLAFASLRFLVTGRKPAVAVMFTQFRQMQRAAAGGAWPSSASSRRGASGQRVPANDAADVVDVEMREIEIDRTDRTDRTERT